MYTVCDSLCFGTGFVYIHSSSLLALARMITHVTLKQPERTWLCNGFTKHIGTMHWLCVDQILVVTRWVPILTMFRCFLFSELWKHGLPIENCVYAWQVSFQLSWYGACEKMVLKWSEYSREKDQHHGCWCSGSLRRHTINSHGIDYVG